MEIGRSDDPRRGRSAGKFIYGPFLAPVKVFRCKYCDRKFLNSRALGGHQNAHKKERTLWMMSYSNHKSIVMESHSLPYNPIREKSSTGKPKESFKRFKEAWRQRTSVVAADEEPSWPGSFCAKYSDSYGPDGEEDSSHGEVMNMESTGISITDLVLSSQQPEQPDQPKTRNLDLNLRL